MMSDTRSSPGAAHRSPCGHVLGRADNFGHFVQTTSENDTDRNAISCLTSGRGIPQPDSQNATHTIDLHRQYPDSCSTQATPGRRPGFR
jgi:hypothetical protein